MKKIFIFLLKMFSIDMVNAQIDSVKYIEMLTGNYEKRWYLEGHTYLSSQKKCIGNTLIIRLNEQQLIVESCDKKTTFSEKWTIYKYNEIWYLSFGKNTYHINILDNKNCQKMFLSKSSYISTRKLTYIYYKD